MGHTTFNGSTYVLQLLQYPYEQDILPPVSTPLAYDPTRCSGCKPRIQALRQIIVIAEIKHVSRGLRKRYSGDEPNISGLGIGDIMSRFAMLLRCFCVYSVVGMVFANCMPIPVKTWPRGLDVRHCSLSGWVG